MLRLGILPPTARVTLTDDITDPRLAKALAHPLRIEILRRLEDRTASPSEIAAEVGAPLTHVSYHVRKLASLGLIELVRTRPKRGVVEHYYSAPRRSRVSDSAWRDTPGIVKRALAESSLEQGAELLAAAAGSGGLEKDGAHFGRIALRLDARGWGECAKIVEDAQRRIEKAQSDAAARIEKDSRADIQDASALLTLLPAPVAESAAPEKPGRRRSRVRS